MSSGGYGQSYNNRNLLNELDLVRPGQLLEKGLPVPGLVNRYEVKKGWCAVMTEGGAYCETLEAGEYSLSRYSVRRNVRAIEVSTRQETLTVISKGEMAIQNPFPLKVDLDLNVDFKVTDPCRVALEIANPLSKLFDRVMQAVRPIIVHATYHELQQQTETIASKTLFRLQAMTLPIELGITVINVFVQSVQVTDVGNDVLANSAKGRFEALTNWDTTEIIERRKAALTAEIQQQTHIDMKWLIMNQKELAQDLLRGGYFDPSRFLNQPTSLPGSVGLPAGFGGSPVIGAHSAALNVPPTAGQLLPPTDIHARMRDELALLEKMPGAKAMAKPGTDPSGVPDGSYDVMVTFPRSSGGTIKLLVTCMPGYPQQPPTSIEVEVGGQATPFQSALVHRWVGNYLVEIAREVKQYFG